MLKRARNVSNEAKNVPAVNERQGLSGHDISFIVVIDSNLFFLVSYS